MVTKEHVDKIQHLVQNFFQAVEYTSFDKLVDELHKFQITFDLLNEHVKQRTKTLLVQHYHDQLAMDCSSFSESSLVNIRDDQSVNKSIVDIVQQELEARKELKEIKDSALAYSQGFCNGIKTPISKAPWIILLAREYQSIIDLWIKQKHKQDPCIPSQFANPKQCKTILDDPTKKQLYQNGMMETCKAHSNNLKFLTECADNLLNHPTYKHTFAQFLHHALTTELFRMAIMIGASDITSYNQNISTIIKLRANQYVQSYPLLSQIIDMFPSTCKHPSHTIGFRFKALYTSVHDSELLTTNETVFNINRELPLHDQDVVYIIRKFQLILKHLTPVAISAHVSRAFLDKIMLVADEDAPHSLQYQHIIRSDEYNQLYDIIQPLSIRNRNIQRKRITLTSI